MMYQKNKRLKLLNKFIDYAPNGILRKLIVYPLAATDSKLALEILCKETQFT